MLQAVIFDMDGTLVDSEKVIGPLMQSLYADHNITLTDNERASFIGRPVHVNWAYLKEKHDLQYTIEELVHRNVDRYHKWLEEGIGFGLMPGIEDLILEMEMEGILMGVSTSAPREIMEKMLDHFDLHKRFTGLSSAEDVKNGKPAPDIFLRTAKLLDVDPAKCVVFEDSTNGVIGAKAAGMKVVGYAQQGRNSQDLQGADLIVDCYTDLRLDDLLKP